MATRGPVRKRPAKKAAAAKKAAPRTAAVVQKELDTLKARVLEEAKGYVERGDSCRSGVNDFLEAVGLDPLEERVEVRITLSKDFSLKSGESHYAAGDRIAEELAKIVGDGWEVYDSNVVEF